MSSVCPRPVTCRGGRQPSRLSSVHRHYRTLRRVLQAAVEKDRLLANPCARVRPPQVPTRPMAILTWAQSVALAEAHPERTSSR